MRRIRCIASLLLAVGTTLVPLAAHAGLEESVDTPAWSATPAAATAAESDPLSTPSGNGAPGVRTLSVDGAQLGDGPLTPALGVWLIVRHTNALRDGDAFAALDANLATLALLPTEPPAAVPLPAPAWLLVTGLLGMVGARLSRRGRPAGALEAQPAHA